MEVLEEEKRCSHCSTGELRLKAVCGYSVCVRMSCKHRKKELTWGKAGYRGKSKTIPSSALLALSSPLIVAKVRVLFVFSGQRRKQESGK